MFNIISSWYQPLRKWYRISAPFYEHTPYMHFDNTINLLRMFQEAGEKTVLMVLNYEPQLRSFLYDQGVETANLWSLFDELQDLDKVMYRKIRLADLRWPQGAEFCFTPFLLQVNVSGEVYARVNFSQIGDIFSITYFEHHQRTQEYLFDDRGIISSVIHYQKDHPVYQDFLNKYGQCVFREYMKEDDQRVVIQSDFQSKFQQVEYTSIEEVVIEKVTEKIKTSQDNEATFVVSSHHQHNHVFEQVKYESRVIFSFFGEQSLLSSPHTLSQQLAGTPFFVIDSLTRLDQLPKELLDFGELPNFYEIPPYDTKLKLGHSQRKKELVIYVNCDTVRDNEQLTYVLEIIFSLMLKYDTFQLMLGTYNYYRAIELKNVVRSLQNDFIIEGDELQEIEILGGNQEESAPRIFIKYIQQESDLEEALKYVRLIVDLGIPADVLTQIVGISSGIPQINLLTSSYVKHQANGCIIEDITELEKAILYYLTNLSAWNESLVHSVKALELFTNGSIVNMWKNTIKELETYEESHSLTNS